MSEGKPGSVAAWIGVITSAVTAIAGAVAWVMNEGYVRPKALQLDTCEKNLQECKDVKKPNNREPSTNDPDSAEIQRQLIEAKREVDFFRKVCDSPDSCSRVIDGLKVDNSRLETKVGDLESRLSKAASDLQEKSDILEDCRKRASSGRLVPAEPRKQGPLLTSIKFSAPGILSIKKPVPEFAWSDDQGRRCRLSDYKGKVVVLQWINHECPITKRIFQSGIVAKIRSRFDDQMVDWIAVDSSHFSEDKKASISAWVNEMKIDFPYLLDADGTVGMMYGAKTTPHMFVIDQKGNLAYMGAIDDDAAGDKTTPRNYVEEAVGALLKGSAVATATTTPYGCSVKYKK